MLCTSWGLLPALLLPRRLQKRIMQSSVFPVTASLQPCLHSGSQPPAQGEDGSVWLCFSFLSLLCDQGTHSLHFPPLFPGDNLLSISGNILAELPTDRIVLRREREISLRSYHYLGQLGFHLEDCWTCFSLSLNPDCFFSLIIFDSVQPCKYIFMYTYAVSADFFSLWKAICSHLSWSFSLWKLRCFPSSHCLRIQQNLLPTADSPGGRGRHRLWWC